MRPHKIFEEFPQSRKIWHDARLIFIANKLVMTAGDVPGHPHHTVMIDEFHEQYLRIKDQLPTVYPAPEALVHMASVQANAESGIFLAKQKNAAEQREWKKKGRQLHAAACRCATSIRKHSLVKNMHTLGMGGLKPS